MHIAACSHLDHDFMLLSPVLAVLAVGFPLVIALWYVGTVHPPTRASEGRSLLRGVALLTAAYGAISAHFDLPPDWHRAADVASTVLWVVAVVAAVAGEVLHRRLVDQARAAGSPAAEQRINLLTLLALVTSWLGWLTAAGAVR